MRERHGNSTGVSSCRIKVPLEQIHSVASSNENRAVEGLRTRSDMLTEDRRAEILASVEKPKKRWRRPRRNLTNTLRCMDAGTA